MEAETQVATPAAPAAEAPVAAEPTFEQKLSVGHAPDGPPPGSPAALAIEQPTPVEGKQASNAAPATEQVGEAPVTPDDGQVPPQGKDPVTPAAAPAVDLEQLKKELDADEPEADRLERKERDLAASSKEAQNLNEQLKVRNEVLADAGVKWVEDVNGNQVLVASGKSAKDAPGSLGEMPDQIQAAFKKAFEDTESTAEDLAKILIDNAPTISVAAQSSTSVVKPISPEREAQALSTVIEKWGSMQPNVEEHMPLIKDQIDGGGKAMKEMYASNPEKTIRLINSGIEIHRNAMAARAAETEAKNVAKQEEAQKAGLQTTESVDPGVVLSEGVTTAKKVAGMIAGANLGFQ